MKRIKGYDNKIIVAHIPTLDEAQKHYEQTGEFIISSTGEDSDGGFDGDNVNEALENSGLNVVDKVELGIREADARNIIQHTPKPTAEPAPAPAEPAPSE